MGRFSKQWMISECNIRNHCLDVELFKPIVLNGQRFRHVYVTEIQEPEIARRMLNELPFVSNDHEGNIRVKGFITSPDDIHSIEIDMNNIDRISKIG